MTALSLALVACTALVCATRLLLRYLDVRVEEAKRSPEAMAAVKSLEADVGPWIEMAAEHKAQIKELESQVESLRAHVAMRGM